MTAAAEALAPARTGRRVRIRHLWFVPGLALALYANSVAETHGLGLGPILLFGILPHATALLGFGQPKAKGQMGRRAVPVFNVAHHPGLPVAMIAIAATGLIGPFWLVSGLAWLSHIVIDWGLGDGRRTRDGFKPTR